MLFNSLEFGLFFLIVFSLYWFLKKRGQNILLLIASYFFYGFWDWRFLSLLLISTVIDYLCALAIANSEHPQIRKRYFLISLIGNLGILGFFKYFGFFTESFQIFLHTLGLKTSIPVLNIILPVGISFYTFQTMSYTIDVYKGTIQPATRFLDFALYVSFFPQLVAGPIERARNLLNQIEQSRFFNSQRLYEGCLFIFWGLFKKVFIADNLATMVDPLFSGNSDMNLWVALYAFAFQIYCDFSGYSDIACGLANCLGFRLVQNFDLPYFSTNPKEFWQRWHISLSQWLRDYLYISLGGNRGSQAKQYRNLFLTMVLGGLWHGAAWTFVLWGAFHGLLLVVHREWSRWREKFSWQIGSAGKVLCLFLFFHLVCIGWFFFRAESLGQIFHLMPKLLETPSLEEFFAFLSCVWMLWIVQLFQYFKNDRLIFFRTPVWARVPLYAGLFYLIVLFGVFEGKEFIYFQF